MKQSFCSVSGIEKNSIDEAIQIYTPYLSTVLYHMAGNSLPKEDIEEIVADVFIVLWKNAGRIDLQKGTLRSYLAAVARNFALKRINRKTDHTFLEDIELSDGKNFIEENFHNNYVWETVMSLGEPDSEIFVRRYKFDEKSRTFQKQWDLIFLQLRPDFQEEKKTQKNVIECGGKIMRRKNLLKELGIQNRQILPAMLLILIQRISDREFMQNLTSQIQKGSKRL